MDAPSSPESSEPLPARGDYGRGVYRRAIVLEAEGDEAWGELADDFHHFAVRLRHDGERIVAIAGEDVRVPWATCPGAVEPLRRMEGAELDGTLPELQRHTDARAQCTHLHDLACITAAHAARVRAGGAARRRYDVAVPDRVKARCEAVLERDGGPIARWTLQGFGLEAATPKAFEAMPLRGAAFREFLAGLEPELAEAGWVFQRAVFIALGRQHDFDRMDGAWHFSSIVGSSCHTFSPERIGDARRIHGSVRDFTASAAGILDREKR